MNLRLLQALIIALVLACGFTAGFYWPRVPDCSAEREREYVRVVSAIARTMRCSTEEEFAAGRDHECDPSEIEQDAGLVDVGNFPRSPYAEGRDQAIRDISNCTIEDAHAEKCFIPCSTDADCVEKNGQEDH